MSLKDIACKEIDKHATALNNLSQDIWNHPEENFEEKYAHKVLTDFLEKHGFKVERHFKLNTAFRAVYGESEEGPHVTILCEYDALPGIGHACGHNLIAEVGVAAGIGVKAAFDVANKPLGKLTVLGTPAEEGGGGKIDLINEHVFDDVDVAMMAHPSAIVVADPKCLALIRFNVKYYGMASHAAGFPWEGVNALDAAVLCYQNISCLRQQMKPTWRVHGVIKKGGEKPNIIPDFTELEYYIRAPTVSELDVLKGNVIRCFESAAEATGCTVEYTFDAKGYSNLITNNTICQAYVSNAEAVKMEFSSPEVIKNRSGGSTDMGNVSHVIPSIHPNFYVGRPVPGHSRAFQEAAGSPEAQPYALQTAKALALTAIDILTSPDLLSKIKADFKKDTGN